MESTVSIDQFQEELQSWKHELSSFKQQIRHFEQQLEAMSAKKLPKDLLAQVEHFQNSFICQKEVIDKLRHDLPDSRHKVEHIYRNIQYVRTIDDGSAVHEILQERMGTFRKLYKEVREDFSRFESEWI
jgi:predicted RNase H-like nuclease (RuvC/YqgF family)